MKAIGIKEYGDVEKLEYFQNINTPLVGENDVLIRVKAFSINPIDIKVRKGMSSGGTSAGAILQPPRILGYDGAGCIEAIGKNVTRFHEGDEVFFINNLMRSGSYAEYTSVNEALVALKPKTHSFSEAAALPLTAITAWEALLENMKIPRSPKLTPRTILIIGGAGGVGSIAIQIAKYICGLQTYATCSSEASKEWCLNFGAMGVLNHNLDLKSQLKEIGLEGFDYILNTYDFSIFDQLVEVLNPLGTICGIVGSPHMKNLNLLPMIAKRATLTFEMMFMRSNFGIEPSIQGNILKEIADGMDSGLFMGTCHRILSWDLIKQAHSEMEKGHNCGKIVVKVGS